MADTITDDRLAALEEKIDSLHAEVRYLADTARDARVRREQWDELRADLTPVAAEAFQMASAELDDIRHFVAPADLWRLGKKVIRNSGNIEKMFDQVESLSELASEVTPLGRDVFLAAMQRLDELERKGYFAFASGAMGVVDRVVTSFDEEDVAQLGENIVLILDTVKQMTQPEVMGLLQRTAAGVRDTEVEEIGLLRLLWRMRSPEARRGLGRMLKVLESFADVEPAEPGRGRDGRVDER